jgi:hypothetical protein
MTDHETLFLEEDSVILLKDLVEQFAAESTLPEIFDSRMDFDGFSSVLKDLMTRDLADVIVTIDEQMMPIGVLIFTATPNLFTGDIEARELVWYVKPEYRGTRIAFDLFKAFEISAVDDFNAKLLIMTHLEVSMPEKLKKVYKRRGYQPLETNYMKRV